MSTKLVQKYVAVIFLALVATLPARVQSAAQETVEDRFANSDIRDASQEVDLMNRILAVELDRLVKGSGGAESADAATYLHDASKQFMDLGDVRISLTKRYVEAQRRRWVAAISLAKANAPGACGKPIVPSDQLLDAALRAKVLEALKCRQHRLDMTQSGLHQVSEDYEAAVRKLKLPAFTQEKMLNEAHALTLRQDADIASEFADSRVLWQAESDLLMFLDAHAIHAHYNDHRLQFDEPEENEAMRVLLSRVAAAKQQCSISLSHGGGLTAYSASC